MTQWTELPGTLRDAIERHTGPVSSAVDITSGTVADVATVITGPEDHRVFVKAVQGISRRMRWLRNEIASSELAPGIAPDVRFHADVDDWLVVGVDYVPGRRADLAPGSPDVELVGATAERIAAQRAPDLRPLRDRWSVTNWWEQLAEEHPETVAGFEVEEMARWSRTAPELVHGDRLVHTDLHADQILIAEDGTVRVIDWAWPAAGAPWVDCAFLVLRLINTGHTPEQAEAWASSLTCWRGVDRVMVTGWSAYVAGLWSYRACSGHMPDWLARLARDYAAWCLEQG